MLGREVYVPMELCEAEVKVKKNLDPKETAFVISRTATVSAISRQEEIQSWIQKSGIDHDPILANYQITVNTREMIEFKGQVLPAPDIAYSENRTIKSKQIGTKGSWNHGGYKFTATVDPTTWVIVDLSGTKDYTQFAKELVRIGGNHGMTISPYAASYKLSDVIRIAKAREFFQETLLNHPGLQLVLIIFPSDDSSYKIFKTLGDLEFGVPTQSIKKQTLNRAKEQTISNILLKINTKLGGKNFALSSQNEM